MEDQHYATVAQGQESGAIKQLDYLNQKRRLISLLTADLAVLRRFYVSRSGTKTLGEATENIAISLGLAILDLNQVVESQGYLNFIQTLVLTAIVLKFSPLYLD